MKKRDDIKEELTIGAGRELENLEAQKEETMARYERELESINEKIETIKVKKEAIEKLK